MASQNVDDCYFYFYSSCTKGDDCPYRHCKQALGTETVCSLWREGRCFRSNCKFRHMESQINRSAIPCYWENQPGGCRKPHCVFLHRKLRNGISVDQRKILPVSNGKPSPILPDSQDRNSPVMANSPLSPGLNKDLISDPASVPVPRLVLSFDEAEESDTESVSSTPVKGQPDDNKGAQNDSAKRSLSVKLSAATTKEKDFGIKTLEQIRMEKIHKESNHYYSDDLPNKVVSLGVGRNSTLLNESVFCYKGYEAPSLESPHVPENPLMQAAKEFYPPQSDFISLPPSLDKSLPDPNTDTPRQSLDKESDIRSRLFKRMNHKAIAEKMVLNFKQQSNKKAEESPKDLNFKIKTLDEIRRERENKRGVQPSGADTNSSSAEEDKVALASETQKSSKRLKITRRSKELYAKAVNTTNEVEENKTLSPVTAAQEKRKAEALLQERQRKFLKVNSDQPVSLNGSMPQNGEKENKSMKSLGLFLRQPKVSSPTNASTSVLPPQTNDDMILSSDSQDPKLDCSKQISSNNVSSFDTSPAESSLLPSSSDPENDVFLPSSKQPAVVAENTVLNMQTSEDSVSDIQPKEDCDLTKNNVCNMTTAEDVMVTAEENVCDIPMNEDKPTPGESMCEMSPTTVEESSLEITKDNDVVLDRSASVDEFDNFLNETDMNADETADSGDGDDILLEVEQFLDS